MTKKVKPLTMEELDKMLAEIKNSALSENALQGIIPQKQVKVPTIKNAPQKKIRKGTQKGG